MTDKKMNEKEYSLIEATEEFRAALQYVIERVMTTHQISRSELARRIKCSRSNISQLLSENGNPRIETIAKIFWALDDEAVISSKFLSESTYFKPFNMPDFGGTKTPIESIEEKVVHNRPKNKGQLEVFRETGWAQYAMMAGLSSNTRVVIANDQASEKGNSRLLRAS
jgi:DNA-binding phage protein